ncbi:MAG: conjugal transfer protein TraF [Chlamydiota bacterium]
MYKLTLLFICFALQLSAISPFYKKGLEGFYYYEEREEDPQEDSETAEAAAEILTAFQQEFIGRLKKAVVFPTKKNVRAYRELQDRSEESSTKFEKIWSQLSLEEARFSGQLTNPTDSYAIKRRKEIQASQIETLIREKKETHVLLFFFTSNDPYSQIAAEVVKMFEEKCLWKVIGISLDGEPLPEFPNPRHAKDRGSSLKIQAAPAYVVLHPDTEQAIHVGYGAISMQRLKENIYKQLHKEVSK